MSKPDVYVLFALLAVMLYGCGEKLNGHSEKEFKASRNKVEANLSKEEKNKLEIALRVLVGESMRLKLTYPDKYKHQTFSAIALKLADGHTYSGVVDIAEDILKDSNEREKEKLTKEIDSLEKKRISDRNARKAMSSLFKVDYIELRQEDFFNEKLPAIVISYAYTGKQALTGQVMIAYELYKVGSSEPAISTMSGFGDEKDSLPPGVSIDDKLILSKLYEQEPQKWNNIKYPVKNPDLARLGLRLDVHPVSFTLNGKQMVMPKSNDAELTKVINEDKAALKELGQLKGSLDEMELTENK